MKTPTIATRTALGALAQAGPIIDVDLADDGHRTDADLGSLREST
ncbi:MAG TPA: hypothetical protein VGO85_02400 [Caldimonas sp.]|jgi:hypothetical protein|nr:hypothetical protein [Caldimonas sp.]